MTEFDSTIGYIEKLINELDIKNRSERTLFILGHLMNNKLDLSELSDCERIFIHARLHMDYFNKHSKLSRDQIKSIHSDLITSIKTHQYNDKLDD